MLFKKKSRVENISIGITTFEARFDQFFMPLLSRIREYDAETEIIVAVNGEHNREFSENYRSRLMAFLSTQKKVFPIMFPVFRGLSKLWNTIIIHATCDHILMLNDDIMITGKNFIRKIQEKLVRNHDSSFLINNSWSHFVISRKEVDDLGYFDERLLGIGEEDGDMTWRYLQRYGRAVPSFKIKEFVNYAEETMVDKPANITCRPGTKYSLFNRRFMFDHKYRPDAGGIKGMFDYPVELRDKGPDQYPNERFFRENRHRL